MVNLNQDSRCHVQGLNQAPSEYTARMLPLYHLAQYYADIDPKSGGNILECYSVKTILYGI
jgi:hypothetical protein